MADNLSTVKFSGTSTEKTKLGATLKAADAGFQLTVIGGATYTWNGSAFDLTSASGAGTVTTSPAGISRIRQEAALGATAVTFTWPAPGISAVKLSIASEAAGTAELPAAVAFCIDPLVDAVRDAWLTAGDSISADAPMLIAFADKENETLVFTSPITTLGVKRLWGSQALTCVALGTEVVQ